MLVTSPDFLNGIYKAHLQVNEPIENVPEVPAI